MSTTSGGRGRKGGREGIRSSLDSWFASSGHYGAILFRVGKLGLGMFPSTPGFRITCRPLGLGSRNRVPGFTVSHQNFLPLNSGRYAVVVVDFRGRVPSNGPSETRPIAFLSSRLRRDRFRSRGVVMIWKSEGEDRDPDDSSTKDGKKRKRRRTQQPKPKKRKTTASFGFPKG